MVMGYVILNIYLLIPITTFVVSIKKDDCLDLIQDIGLRISERFSGTGMRGAVKK